MVQPPDEYSIKRKFLEGLPDDIVRNLFKARRMSAEHTPLKKLLREVKAMESAIQAYQNYKNEQPDQPSTKSAQPIGSQQQTNRTTREPRVVRFVKRDQGNYHGGNPQRFRPNNNNNRPAYRPSPRPGGSGQNRGSDNRDNRQNPPRPGGITNSHGNDHGKNSSGHNHAPGVVCFKCGKSGHYADQCPTKDKPRVFAAQIINEDEEDQPPDPEDEEPGIPQGSQYDSDQEKYSLDEYEEYVEVDNYNDEDDDTSVVYIRSGRISEAEPDSELSDSESDPNLVNGITNDHTEEGPHRPEVEVPAWVSPYDFLGRLSDTSRIELF